ncbi:MAG: FAD-dependent monooxygenase [Acidobacteriota bacterium]
MKTDVLIIGAGPTGLALATQLLRYKIDFIIIDKNESTTAHSKAIGVQARTLEIYEQLNIARDLITQGTIVESARLVESGEVRGEIDLKNFGTGMSPYPFLLIVEQGLHEALLYDVIKSQNADVHWLTELQGLSQDAEGVTANVKFPDERIETINARFVVGCDGAHSFVRHALGLKFEGGTFERLFYVADVEIDWKFSHDALHVNLGKDNLTAFFPMRGERRWRIVGTFPEGHAKDEGEILYDEVERQIIADTKINFDITKVNWFSVYKVHSRAVNKFSEGRCFLAGDSAHIHTPAGAQGMNTGIQDGYNLAWKLKIALDGEPSDELLASYNFERLENAKRLLQTTDRFFQFGASEEWFLAFMRVYVFPYVANFALSLDAVKKLVFPLVSQIGISYRTSPLSVGGDGFSVKAGDRMPYFIVDGTSIYDRLHEPSFHLLNFFDGTTPVADLESAVENVADVFTFPLYPNIAEIFGAPKTFSVLLRPDNYIGYIAENATAESVTQYLKHLGIAKN